FLCAMAGGIAAGDVWRALGGSALRRSLRTVGVVVVAVAPVWYGGLSRDALRWVPSAEDRREANALWEDMRTLDGDFLAYNYSFASTVLRGHTYPYGDPLYDHAGGFDTETFHAPVLARYPQDFLDAIRQRRYAAIYTNGYIQLNDPIEY